ncbi:ABC transporter substrate-binding protein [Streptosporangium sp. NPDC087985]|uniref:ABC transporter substrate-binding protein n=1 Tax=Streptosporangium sp. NPDC087985 TaxID=3366196 RepID=UPI00380D582D
MQMFADRRTAARRVPLALTLGTAAALLLAACGLDEKAPAAEPGGAAITIGTLPTDTCSALFTAQEKGFFKQEGLTVDIKSISSGAAISSGVVGGSLQIGCSSIGSVASAFENGIPVRVVSQGAVYASKEPTSALMVAKDSPIDSAKKLAGKTVAVNALKNVTQVATQAWVDKNGGDAKSLKFIELPFSQMGPALAEGRIDAALIAEPDLTLARQKGEVRLLGNAYDAISDRFSTSTFFSSASWAEGNRDAMERFRRALSTAAAYTNDNRQETGEILTRFSKIDGAVVAKMARAEWETTLDLATLQPPLDAAVTYGALPKQIQAADLLADQP